MKKKFPKEEKLLIVNPRMEKLLKEKYPILKAYLEKEYASNDTLELLDEIRSGISPIEQDVRVSEDYKGLGRKEIKEDVERYIKDFKLEKKFYEKVRRGKL